MSRQGTSGRDTYHLSHPSHRPLCPGKIWDGTTVPGRRTGRLRTLKDSMAPRLLRTQISSKAIFVGPTRVSTYIVRHLSKQRLPMASGRWLSVAHEYCQSGHDASIGYIPTTNTVYAARITLSCLRGVQRLDFRQGNCLD